MIQRFEIGARMSEMAVHNGTVYLAGQVADNTSLDIQGQTQQVLASIDALLARASSDKTRILMAQIFLADLADFAGMNIVWDAWVSAGHSPRAPPSRHAWPNRGGDWKSSSPRRCRKVKPWLSLFERAA